MPVARVSKILFLLELQRTIEFEIDDDVCREFTAAVIRLFARDFQGQCFRARRADCLFIDRLRALGGNGLQVGFTGQTGKRLHHE